MSRVWFGWAMMKLGRQKIFVTPVVTPISLLYSGLKSFRKLNTFALGALGQHLLSQNHRHEIMYSNITGMKYELTYKKVMKYASDSSLG